MPRMTSTGLVTNNPPGRAHEAYEDDRTDMPDVPRNRHERRAAASYDRKARRAAAKQAAFRAAIQAHKAQKPV